MKGIIFFKIEFLNTAMREDIEEGLKEIRKKHSVFNVIRTETRKEHER